MLTLSSVIVVVGAGGLFAAPPPGVSGLLGSPGRGDAPPSAVQVSDDVALRLAELSSPSAADRGRAERWLAAHLTAEHAPLVARAADNGDAEVRRRLGLALGAEDSSLELALVLSEAGGAASEVGRAAVLEIAARWCPALDDRPLAGLDLARALDERSRTRRTPFLRVDLGAPLSESVDRLARLGGIGLGLVVDPKLGSQAEEPSLTELDYVGTFDQVVFALAAAHGVGLEAVGLEQVGLAESPAFLRFTPPGEEGSRTGADTLLEWLRLARSGAGRDKALSALAATGWPAAVTWVAARWQAGDAAALDAVLASAAAGLWPPSLARGEPVRALLEQQQRLLGEDDRRAAERVARALAEAPCRLADGASTPELLAVRWNALEREDAAAGGARERERQLVLVALEGTACAGAQDWEARLRALLGDPQAGDAELLRQALRAWIAVAVPAGAAPPEIGAPAPLLGLGTDWSEAAYLELASYLLQADLEPPAALERPEDVRAAGFAPEEDGPRSALVAWWLGAGDVEVAARLLLDGLAQGRASVFGELLRAAIGAGEGAAARALLERARQDARGAADAAALDRVALAAGLLPAERYAELFDAAKAQSDVELFGLLAGEPDAVEGAGAREALLEELATALSTSSAQESLLRVTEALENALAALLRADADGVARSLRAQAWRRVQEAAPSRVRERLSLSGWPPFPPAMAVEDLELLDRP